MFITTIYWTNSIIDIPQPIVYEPLQGRPGVLFFARTEGIIAHTKSSQETIYFIIQKIILLFGI